MMDAPEFPEIGLRLKALRLAFGSEGETQRAWSERHGFNKTQYGNWETGTRRIPVESAERLADRYGLDLDWIYRGREAGLSENARKALSGHRAIYLNT